MVKHVLQLFGEAVIHISFESCLRKYSKFSLSVAAIHRFLYIHPIQKQMSQCMRFPTMWYVRPAKPQISLRIRAVAQSDQSLRWSLEYSMIVEILTEHHLELLSIKEGCTGSSESTLVKTPHCWKSHVTARMQCLQMDYLISRLAKTCFNVIR